VCKIVKSNFGAPLENGALGDRLSCLTLTPALVTETFYSKQVWLYNLTFVIYSENNQSKKNCFLYTWLETESGRGPNEIVSALIHSLNILGTILKYPWGSILESNVRKVNDQCGRKPPFLRSIKKKRILELLTNNTYT